MLVAENENLLKSATGAFDVLSGGTFAATQTWRGGNQANPAYGAAAVNCLNKGWQPLNISGDAAIAESWELMTGRIRDLIRNDPVLTKALRMMVDLCIGSGIQSFSEASDASGEYMEDFAEESDDRFEEWATDEADISERMTFYDMQRLSFKELAQTGVSIWLEVLDTSPERRSPLAYQLLEYEQLDRTRDRPSSPGRNRIVNGIELNRFSKATAAYIYDAHPYDTRSIGIQQSYSTTGIGRFRSTRVPISRLIIDYIPDRISSHIGITWFSCLIQTTRDLDKMLANELTSRAVAALMTMFVKRENPGSSFGDALNAELGDRPGQNIVSMGYPHITEIGMHEDIGIAQSKGGSRDAKIFVDLMLGQVAMGSGMSINRLKGDPEQANLAAILSAHRDDERMIGPIQEHQVNRVVRPIRKRFDAIAAGLGDYSAVGVSAAEYRRRLRWMQKYLIIPSGDPDIRDKESTEAAIDRMRSGLSSPQIEVTRATGVHWRRVLKHFKQYFAELDRLGLGYPDWTKGAGGTYLPFVALNQQPAMQNRQQGEAA